MARRPTLSQALAELIAKLEPELADAFMDAINDLRSGIDMAALQQALEAGNIQAAISALNIEAGAFNAYVATRTMAYSRAGALAATYIPLPDGESVRFRFDMTNPRAERWIREQAAQRVVGYTQEQVEAAQKVIVDGYARGAGPKQIATDIAGRVDRVTGRRTGGIVGLSEPQAGYVSSMRERLLSGDPGEMRKVLGRFDKDGKWIKGTGMTLRDRRYDALIRRHIEAGTSLSQKDVDKLTQRYADRLLARRAEDIARTETAQSVMGARAEAYEQALEKEGLPPEALTKQWVHLGGPGENARVQHMMMDGIRVVGANTPFIMPDGVAMQHSHDPDGGPAHTIGCRCSTDFRLDFTWGL